jgi:DHA1 family multidrug resistance protein-like MFS transporter
MGSTRLSQTEFSSATPASGDDALWRRNLRALWVASFIAMIGMNACLPFLPLYVRQLGVTDLVEAQRWTGFVYAGSFMLSIFTVPLWGVLGDKYGKKLMITRAVFGLALAMFLMGFAHNVWHLFWLRVFQGVASGFIAACISLVSASAPDHKRGYAISVIQTAISAGTVVGPLLGGAVADAFGVRSLFYGVAALCFASGIVVVFRVQEPPGEKSATARASDAPATERARASGGIVETLRVAWQTPALRSLLALIVLAQSALNFTPPILAYFLETKGAPPALLATLTGAAVGIVGVLIVIFAPYWGRQNDRKGYAWALRRIAPWLALTTAAQAFIPSYEWIYPLRVVMGVVAGGVIPILYAGLGKHTPRSQNSAMMGLASSATLLGGLIAPILSGWIASTAGMEWSFLVSAALFLAILSALSSPRHFPETARATAAKA